METWLVTGGAGFIGSCFVHKAIAERAIRIVNLDRLTYAGNLDSLEQVMACPAHVFVQGDIANGELVGKLLDSHQPTAVIHLAAESHVDRSIDGPKDFVRTNVLGTCALLDEVRRYWRGLPPGLQANFRFLHVSTDEVYGSAGHKGYFTEASPYAPHSPYAASKAASDHIARAYYHTYGLPVLVTNCSNNYGPRQFPEKLIPLMILNALEGKPLPIYGDGQQVRDWIYVEDHCAALCRVLTCGQPGETYNIGGACERTNTEIVLAICRVIDELCPALPHVPCANLITFVTDRPGHDRRYAVDASKLRNALNWRPLCPLHTGLRRTVQWYLGNPAWVERVTTGKYRRERLGLSGEGTWP